MALRMSDNLRKKNEKEFGNSYFSKPGDLDVSTGVINGKKSIRDEIESYLSLVVSGERYGFQKRLPYSGGTMMVSFEKLNEMVDRGDNIIKAECLDDNGVLISIEYESYGNVENNKQGRGR